MSAVNPKAATAVVVGLGRTGFSCARYLAKRGWRVAVTDTREAPPELARLRAMDAAIEVRLGGLDPALLEEALCVVVSPGISLAAPFFTEARRRGLEIVGDIELFARAVDAPVAGITGTNGKSTVTTLLGRMARRAGVRVRVGGNLGEPALDLLDADDPAVHAARTDPNANVSPGSAELYVLELSSFQLETTESLHLAAAAVLNVSADHLDRYASLEDYAAAKARIFARCDTAVINLDDPLVVSMPRPGQRTLGFSLRGAHRRRLCACDARAAVVADAARHASVARRRHEARRRAQRGECARGARARRGARACRCRPCSRSCRASRACRTARNGWPRCAASPTSTTPRAPMWAPRSPPSSGMQVPVVLIAGGEGKNQDFTPLKEALRGKLRHAVLIGRAADALAPVLAPICSVERASSLEAAVRAAAQAAAPGDAVLLSPACASFDMFSDYNERGAVFVEAVRGLAA